jgi:hypothetical protein
MLSTISILRIVILIPQSREKDLSQLVIDTQGILYIQKFDCEVPRSAPKTVGLQRRRVAAGGRAVRTKVHFILPIAMATC